MAISLGLFAPVVAAGQTAGSPAMARRLDRLASDTERAESIRAIKRLQYTYAQYTQMGMWKAMAATFAEKGEAIFEEDHVRGREAIARYFLKRFGDGHEGLPGGAVQNALMVTPVVNLSADGQHAKGRWHELAMIGRPGEKARWVGGIQENDYVRVDGRWKIARLHFHRMFAGSYDKGWRNVDADLKVVPYHYTPDQAGVPIPPAADIPPLAEAREAPGTLLDTLESRIGALNDADSVRNLLNAYGYYIDRKMWDDVTDLFTKNGVYERSDVGIYAGAQGIRHGLELQGPAGLKRGEINDHILYDATLTVASNGKSAHARAIQLGMLGDAGKGSEYWTMGVVKARFVKDGGTWRIRSLRVFPLHKADYRKGWGRSRVATSPPPAALQPDRPTPAADMMAGTGQAIPAFSSPNPATGLVPQYPSAARVVGRLPLVSAADSQPDSAAPVSPNPVTDQHIDAATRNLARATAHDGVENVSSAFGNYIDDFAWHKLAALFAKKGAREEPRVGFYIGHDRIEKAEIVLHGHRREPRRAIPIHMRIQPVIHVAPDGRSANLRTRLFAMFSIYDRPGVFQNGMYPNDQAVLENGVWKLWNVAIDEYYFRSASYQGGWADFKPKPGSGEPPEILKTFPPDIGLPPLGVRERGFIPYASGYVEWPDIKPMWFSYRNPVSGRRPPLYWPQCVTCALRPDTRLDRNGYMNVEEGS